MKWFEILNTVRDQVTCWFFAETVTLNPDGTFTVHPTGATSEEDGILHLQEGETLREKDNPEPPIEVR